MPADILSRSTGLVVAWIASIALVASVATVWASRKDRGKSAPSIDLLTRIWLAAALVAAMALTLNPRLSGFEAVRKMLFNPFSAVDLPDAIANTMLFLPIGVFAALLLRSRHRPVATATGLAVLVSLTLELAQWVLPIGRVSGTHDVISNTVGAFIGASAAVVAMNRFNVPAK